MRVAGFAARFIIDAHLGDSGSAFPPAFTAFLLAGRAFLISPWHHLLPFAPRLFSLTHGSRNLRTSVANAANLSPRALKEPAEMRLRERERAGWRSCFGRRHYRCPPSRRPRLQRHLFTGAVDRYACGGSLKFPAFFCWRLSFCPAVWYRLRVATAYLRRGIAIRGNAAAGSRRAAPRF